MYQSERLGFCLISEVFALLRKATVGIAGAVILLSEVQSDILRWDE